MEATERKKREPPDSDDPPQLKKQNTLPEAPEPVDPKVYTFQYSIAKLLRRT